MRPLQLADPSQSQDAFATRPTASISRHRPAWYAVDTQLMLTIYDSLSHAPWVEGRATNSQCPCAAYIIGNCIRREMNWPGGVASGSILSKLRNGCGRKRSPPVRLESSA